MLRFFTAAVNAPFAAVNWIFTGASGYVSTSYAERERFFDEIDNDMADYDMQQIRAGENPATLIGLPSIGHTWRDRLITYARIAAKERVEHITP